MNQQFTCDLITFTSTKKGDLKLLVKNPKLGKSMLVSKDDLGRSIEVITFEIDTPSRISLAWCPHPAPSQSVQFGFNLAYDFHRINYPNLSADQMSFVLCSLLNRDECMFYLSGAAVSIKPDASSDEDNVHLKWLQLFKVFYENPQRGSGREVEVYTSDNLTIFYYLQRVGGIRDMYRLQYKDSDDKVTADTKPKSRYLLYNM